MEQLDFPTSAPASPGAQFLAALVLAVGVVLFAGAASWNAERAPFPFVWWDVALVHLVSALPGAWLLAALVSRRVTAVASVALAAVLLGGDIALFSSSAVGIGFRAVAALGGALAMILLLTVLRGGNRSLDQANWIHVGVATAVLLMPPAIYVKARCQHDMARLGELLEQSRFGEARTLAKALSALDASQRWNGRSLAEVNAEIDRVVREIESRIVVPLALHATVRERLERARQLAMLGRTEAAIDVLQSVREPTAVAGVENLCGVIWETRNEWEIALTSYQTAKAAWETQSFSTARTAGLLQAIKGVAYCQRKLGHYAEAEMSYQQMLAISPTADAHYLLAQFYEDSQQAQKARVHARRAIELAPAAYQQKGESLIRKLTVFHFGCLGVLADENDSRRVGTIRH